MVSRILSCYATLFGKLLFTHIMPNIERNFNVHFIVNEIVNDVLIDDVGNVLEQWWIGVA